jgi:hypothetical protein
MQEPMNVKKVRSLFIQTSDEDDDDDDNIFRKIKSYSFHRYACKG